MSHMCAHLFLLLLAAAAALPAPDAPVLTDGADTAAARAGAAGLGLAATVVEPSAVEVAPRVDAAAVPRTAPRGAGRGTKPATGAAKPAPKAASPAAAPRAEKPPGALREDGDGDDGPPFNKAFPSPTGRGVARSGGPVGILSLGASLPELYDPAVGGRGLSPARAAKAAKAPTLSFAAKWAGAAAARIVGLADDMQAAENETPDPRRESLLTAGLDPAKPNRLGAKLDDVPVAKATPVEVLASAVLPPDQAAASRLVIRNGSAPARLGFAAGAAVDQPTRRFRPPDQSLCVGAGTVITGNNLVLRTFNATTGDPIDGPIDQPSFFKMTGNFSDPGCIFDADTRRFFMSLFRFNEAPTGKYSQYIVAVSKSSNPSDGWLGPYVFRNDGLDAAGKTPLPGLEKCRGDADMEAGCLGDYPSIGLDAHSLWAGFNLFKDGEGYAGSLMLAISKPDLLSGAASTPAHAVYSNWNMELAYTVQPSVTQAGSAHDAGRGGTIYFASTAPVVQNEPNVPALATWAATGTSKLTAPDFPKGGLPLTSNCALLDTPAYRDPGVFKARKLGVVQPAPGFPLDGGDARTLQHMWSGGVLWTAAQTVSGLVEGENKRRRGSARAKPTHTPQSPPPHHAGHVRRLPGRQPDHWPHLLCGHPLVFARRRLHPPPRRSRLRRRRRPLPRPPRHHRLQDGGRLYLGLHEWARLSHVSRDRRGGFSHGPPPRHRAGPLPRPPATLHRGPAVEGGRCGWWRHPTRGRLQWGHPGRRGPRVAGLRMVGRRAVGAVRGGVWTRQVPQLVLLCDAR